jgi:hypothetical protein
MGDGSGPDGSTVGLMALRTKKDEGEGEGKVPTIN